MKKNVCEFIGHTPLLEIENIEKELGLCARVAVKLEYLNPAGSAKDRAALYIINRAEQDGLLKPGATIIEPTSGNTGIGLAMIGARRGYRVILTMPDTMSRERRSILKAYGAEIVLTPGKDGMQGSVAKAEELKAQIPGSVIAGQFENPANAQAHYETTGPEIWEDAEEGVDIFVAGVGTGGTITGIGRYLKEKNPDVCIVACEPKDSPLISRGISGPHKIQGIGANFIPALLDQSVIDEVALIEEEKTYAAAKLLARKEGILVGISSGGALSVALELAAKKENTGKLIVALLPDSADRYYSSPLFEE